MSLVIAENSPFSSTKVDLKENTIGITNESDNFTSLAKCHERSFISDNYQLDTPQSLEDASLTDLKNETKVKEDVSNGKSKEENSVEEILYGKSKEENNTEEISDKKDLIENNIEDVTEKLKDINITKEKVRYKNYTAADIQKLIIMVRESESSIRKAAEACGIPLNTAYNIRNHTNRYAVIEPSENKTPLITSKIRKIHPEHTAFIKDLIEQNPCITLQKTREQLYFKFPDMKRITISGLHEHMKRRCNYQTKKTKQKNDDRDNL